MNYIKNSVKFKIESEQQYAKLLIVLLSNIGKKHSHRNIKTGLDFGKNFSKLGNFDNFYSF